MIWSPAATADRRRLGRRGVLAAALLLALLGGGAIGLLVTVPPLLWLLLLGAGPALLAVARRPALAVYALAVAVPLTSTLPRGSPVPLLKPNELLLGLLVALALAREVLNGLSPGHPRSLFGREPLGLAFGVYLLGVIVLPGLSALATGAMLTTSDVTALLAPVQYFLLYRLARAAVRSERQAAAALAATMLTGLLVAIIGIAQAFQLGDVPRLLAQVYPTGEGARALAVSRITSTLAGWNDLAAYLACCVVTGLTLAASSRSRLLLAAILPACGVCLLGIALAGSFAPMLGILAALLALAAATGARRGLPRLLAAVALTVLGTGLAIAQAPSLQAWVSSRLLWQSAGASGLLPTTLVERLGLWPMVLEAAARGPLPLLFGSGPTTDHIIRQLGPSWALVRYFLFTERVYGGATEESQYLLLLLRFGLVGLLAHAVLVVAALRLCLARLRAEAGLARMAGRCGLALLAMFSVMGVSNAYFTYSGAAETLWLVLALASRRSLGRGIEAEEVRGR